MVAVHSVEWMTIAARVSACIYTDTILNWMRSIILQLNADKTE